MVASEQSYVMQHITYENVVTENIIKESKVKIVPVHNWKAYGSLLIIR